MLRGGWRVGAETGASNGGVPPDTKVFYRPYHTLGRRRLRGPPGEEANKQAAKDTELVLGGSRF
eukprot:8473890-Prorocentrum_lima.AAC.1